MKKKLTAGSIPPTHFGCLQVSKWFLRLTFLIVWVLGIAANNDAIAQESETKISGIVRNEKGEPLSGVTVVVKGSAKATMTGDDGKYVIVVPSANSVLVFSYTGMRTEEHKVGENSTINLTLVATDLKLDDVIIVGYGKQKKATLTGAVEQVTSKTFESRAITNVGLALQGASPGLVVTRTSPRPGNENMNFIIRGQTSVNGSKPLIIVDGVPAMNDYSFQNMNSDDIESISVLKDASAAIYGSRASNGVILVTTKRGKGKLKVDYTGNLRWTTNGIIGYSPDMQQYATMWLDANKEETNPNYWIWGSKDNLLKMQQGIEGAYPVLGIDFFIYNSNRLKEMFATRYSKQHNLSLSSSNDRSAYRLSFGYADNQGNLATAYDGQKQYNVRFNHDYKFSEKLKLESTISLIDAKTSTPSVGLDNTVYGYDMPFFPAKNPFGQWFASFNAVDGGARRNAAAMTTDGGRDNRNSLTGRIDLKATYQLYKDLAFEGMASLQNERFTQEKYVLQVPVYNWYGTIQRIGTGTEGTNNRYYTYAWTGYYQYYSALLRYNKNIGEHNISAVAGINAEKNTSQWVSATRIGFDNLGVQDISLASTASVSNDGFKTQMGRYSYLARVNYNYAEKYLLELLGRRDGNSRFAQGFKFKNFGSASVGWVFTRENFLKDLNSVLSFGKIRASYGTSGNEANDLGEFDYLSTVRVNTSVLGQSGAWQTATSLNNNGLISYTRTWEKVRQKNLGIDLSFLRNRLTSSFDYFVKDNIGMLINVSYPAVLGGNAPKTNNGHFNTKGWEAIIGWNDRKGDFSYNVAFNISNTRTKVTGVEGADTYTAGKNSIVNGYAYQPWFVYKTDGYFKDQKEVDAYYTKYGTVANSDLLGLPQANADVALRPGDTKKVDATGVGNITGVGSKNSSLVYAGDGTPHYTFGFNMGASYKGFDFSAFFQGQFKQLIMRSGWMSYPFLAIWSNQNPTFIGKTWTADNPGAIYPRLTVNTTRSKWNYANNDFMLQNNRYVRLKTLIVGYTLPKKLTEKAKLQRVRVYFSGNDLWEKAKVRDGYDPEMGEASVDFSTSDGKTTPGGGYPFSRTWSFGINVGL
ncbi:SusC/RagA family TonB-linked outer membrane protein [Niastella vici]|uniref:SusC/RagA family TonB-linked outer membrane protein n=1 Tax=Niastella vici TaxID=1703345 RepID=UPI0009C0055E|nr:TonB-dependent receptor [Niastella vici]